jgi:phosphoglycerol transferase MdoB-like AlkP superfamily enzyme
VEVPGLKMARPYPNLVANNSMDVITYANTVTDGWIAILFTIASFIILLLIFNNKLEKFSDSLLGASFITLILAILLSVAGVIAGKIVIIYTCLMIGSLIYSSLDN